MSETKTNQQPSWHSLEIDEVFSRLDAQKDGLSEKESQKRLQENGPNKLRQQKKKSAWQRLLAQFNNVLIYILIAAAILTVILGKWVDSAVIAAVVLINALLGFIQEGKAQRAMESIRNMLTPEANVLRDNQRQTIPAEKLVPGDILMAGSGDRIAADIRIFESRNAQIDEANLTGESEPITKKTGRVEEDAALGDRLDMAYSSTIVTSGQIKGVVVATGEQSEIGRIGQMVSGVEEISTPLLRKVDKFGKKLSVAIIILSAVIFLYGYFVRNFQVEDIFMVVVGLAVAAIPEGLPAIMTITLALGVQRMAKRNAIIRKLPAVETLGSVTVIFSDKTGTLTRNEMTVEQVALAEKTYSVSGAGYAPEGEFSLENENAAAEQDEILLELARAGMLCSNARLKQEDDNWTIEGMPTEGAAVVLAYKAGLKRQEQEDKYSRVDEIPFESERRYMATLHSTPEGKKVAYIKGAPERVLDMCSAQKSRESNEFDKDSWLKRQHDLADSGHRVLAIATKHMEGIESLEEDQLSDITLLGLIGILDPPREEAIDAVEKCKTAGIRVKMVTGDHALTARSIGASMGIGDGTRAITGKDLDKMEDDEFARAVQQDDVFARSSPEHKLRMIKALQAQGQIVAMTGDGVNDAPALKRADVGVAMGIKGSEASKEAAEIVLADDNFATIERAVEEGRTIYDNLIKTILFILPTNGAESLIVIASTIILFDAIPITPLQILWVNMITAVTLALALAFEPSEKGIMQRGPRPPDEPIISGYLLWRILFVSVIIATATILHFIYRQRIGAGIDEARTVAVNTLVAGQLFYLFNSRFLFSSSLSLRGIVENKAALVAVGALILIQLVFTYFGPVQQLFGTTDISLNNWIIVLAAGLGVFLLVELEKAIVRIYGRRSEGEGKK